MSMQYKITVDGIEYGEDAIVSASILRPLFDKLSIGNACEGMLTLVFYPTQTVNRMAEIIAYGMQDQGSWQQIGVFYIDSRTVTPTGMMTVIAYDSMLMADTVWVPDNSLSFPMTMAAAADALAEAMGITVDPRSQLSTTFTIDYPANDYTLRNVLEFIAAANAGNWIITAANQLLLVPLNGSMPPETYYLITQDGDAITFAGTRILV